jgi:hypothetical protein
MALVLAALMSLWISPARAGQKFEDFESYDLGTNLNMIGWGVSGGGAIVTNLSFTNTSTRSAGLQPETTITNVVNIGTSEKVVWTEFWLGESNRLVTSDLIPVDTNAVFFAGLSTNGYLYVYNPALTNWDECTTDVWDHVMSPATTLWNRITVLQNFTNHQISFFINDHLVRQQVSFINTNINAYNRFQMESGAEGNAYLDNVLISNTLRDAATRLDVDGDGRSEADELLLYGNATNWNGVAVTGRVATADGTVTPSGLINVPYQGSTNFSFAATSVAYVVDYVLTNSAVAASNVAPLKTGTFTWSNVVTEASVFEVHFRYDGTRYIPAEYGSINGALAAAQAGDRLVISNGTYTGEVALSNGVTLVGTNMTGSATNLTVQGTMTVGTGSVSVASGSFTVTGQVTVLAGGVLAVSNTVVDFGGLTILAGATVQVVDGTLTADGATVTGSFTLDQNWGVSVKAMPLNFTDGFESYGVGSRLAALMSFGWGASDTGVIVTNPASPAPGSTMAVFMPGSTLVSNRIDGLGAGLTNIWTDLYLAETQHIDEMPAMSETNGGPAVLFYVDTNGWLVVFNRDVGGWDICSNAVSGANSPRATDTWARVTWFQNFGTTNAAFFLNGILVREQVPFVAWRPQYGGLKVDGGSASLYLDSVLISTNVPPSLTNDGDHDGISDADEIARYGTLLACPRGSLFKIR